VRLALQIGLAVVVFGFLVLTVISQWSEIKSEGVHFHILWLIPALIILPFYFVVSAYGWDLTLRSLGYRIGFGVLALLALVGAGLTATMRVRQPATALSERVREEALASLEEAA